MIDFENTLEGFGSKLTRKLIARKPATLARTVSPAIVARSIAPRTAPRPLATAPRTAPRPLATAPRTVAPAIAPRTVAPAIAPRTVAPAIAPRPLAITPQTVALHSPQIIPQIIAPTLASKVQSLVARLPELPPALAPILAAKSPTIALAAQIAHSQGQTTITPPTLAAASSDMALRSTLAANLLKGAITTLANKAPKTKDEPTHIALEKAHKVVAPVCRAMKCPPKKVICKLNLYMSNQGYPLNTATSVLALIHDMNDSLEKAAIQRLATYEHKGLRAKKAFERQVLTKLSNIARKLPPNSPARTKANLTILKRAV